MEHKEKCEGTSNLIEGLTPLAGKVDNRAEISKDLKIFQQESADNTDRNVSELLEQHCLKDKLSKELEPFHPEIGTRLKDMLG